MNYPIADLAIAVPQFPISETFVLNHINSIAPGSTVIISMDDPEGVVPPEIRFICDRTGWRGIAARLERRFRLSSVLLEKFDQRRHASFLRSTGVRALLVEFLTFACRFVEPARKASVPLFAYAHGWDVAAAFRDAKLRLHCQVLFGEAAGVVVGSAYMLEKVAKLGCPREKVHIIPCGIEPSLFTPSSHEEGRLLAIGRLVEKKAPHLTLQAFARVLDSFPSAHLHMIGDGPMRERCEQVIEESGIRSSVTLHGAQPPEAVREQLRCASVFVQHSVTASNGDAEGLGVSLLEAQASEIPVVATNHNGFPDTIEDGRTGFLVEEHDVDAMAHAVMTLLDDPAKARHMGKAGRKRVEKFFALELSAAKLRELLRVPARISRGGASRGGEL